jgi:hypothetical protein
MLPQIDCDHCHHRFTPRQANQRFCSPSHHAMHYQRKKKAAQLSLSSDIDTIKQENERLKEENERWKESLRRHNNIKDFLEEQTDRFSEQIKRKDTEIEQLKLERRVYNQRKVKRAAHFTRAHLELVLKSEIKRQFPNNEEMQTHIGAIQAFNASYIHALVTGA